MLAEDMTLLVRDKGLCYSWHRKQSEYHVGTSLPCPQVTQGNAEGPCIGFAPQLRITELEQAIPFTESSKQAYSLSTERHYLIRQVCLLQIQP